MPPGLIRTSLLLIMIIHFHWINGQSISCSDQEQSSLCFCRSNLRRSSLLDLFLAQVALSQCRTTSFGIRQCRQGRFYPSSTHVTQLLPNLVNRTDCLQESRCLSPLANNRSCQRCQINFSSFLTENTSYVISPIRTNLPSNSCFYLCQDDQSCGFLCFDRRVSIQITCDWCQGRRRRNITCRCMKERSFDLCHSSWFDTTTPRWMQKRGFPAAGILGLLVLVTILLIILGKLINRRLNQLARRKNSSIHRSIATITTYRSRQPSPSTVISYPNTPLMTQMHLRKNTVTTNTMVELLNSKSQEYVVDIHRRDDEDELSVYLFEKTPVDNGQMKEIADIDDDEQGNPL